MAPAWLLLITNLSGHNPTLRMRIWRALKAAGAGLLRDGAYVLPSSDRSRQVLEQQSTVIRRAGGSAHILAFDAESDEQKAMLVGLFDRASDYGLMVQRLDAFKRELEKRSEP